MITGTKKQKNWFRRHWIITIFICLFIIIGVLTTLEKNTGESTKNSGLDNSKENQNSTESNQSKECTGKFFEQICISSKLNECTKLCSGEDINIPAVKSDCYSTCYQVYYNLGEQGLDDLIKEFE